jgi:phosphoribosylaminoimidazole carboxylase
MQRTIIGIIGGGQLGYMLMQSGMNYPIDFRVYGQTEVEVSPNHTKGDLNDYNKIIEFGKECDILTIEIENINIDALKVLRDQYNKTVYPQPEVLELIKNRMLQKDFLFNLDPNIYTMDYFSYDNLQNMYELMELLNTTPPFVNKIAIGGYDGYGTRIIKNDLDLLNVFKEPSIMENYCDIKRELSIIVGRTRKGSIVVYPPTEMHFNDQNMLDYLICPAPNVDNEYLDKIGTIIAESLDLIGVLAIELFESYNGKIYVNELAPRPHNSGHHTQDMFNFSQFDILIRCLLDLPLPKLVQYWRCGACINILGDKDKCGQIQYNQLDKLTNGKIHLYNKLNTKPYRKLGHYNIMDNDYTNLMNQLTIAKGIINECISATDNIKSIKPLVGVIMGSISDLPIMQKAIDILKHFEIPYEVKIVSAHRTPQQMVEYASTSVKRGLKVIIAGAGGAAHLPGMTASCTTLPVIGIPIKSSNSIDGWDSILSILQMPNGIPTATINLNGAENAGLLAVRMLGYNDEMNEYQKSLEAKVENMNEELLHMK